MSANGTSIFGKLMALLGSYGLACLLLLALFVLTLQGTLYQVDHGLFDAKKRYFESWFVWSQGSGASYPIFPGGVLCMALLAVNLVVGGIVRMQLGKRTFGVLVIHLGIAFMLVASLVKMTNSEEGHLTLYEGEESDHFKSYHDWEVAVWEVKPGGMADEFVIENHLLTDLVDGRKRSFSFPGIPFELELSNFLVHCDPLPKGPNWTASSPVVDGYALLERPRMKETERHVAGMYARAIGDGAPGEALLWGFANYPWTIESGGKTWAVTMRHSRYQMPYTIRLDDFQKEDHPGISMAKAYRSFVYKVDDTGEDRVLIQMNEPLREGGLVLFQSGWGPQGGGPNQRLFSTFSVVRNPSDKWPEYALWVITAGMLITFGSKLLQFISKSTRKSADQAGGAA
jgi:hypothetical protein